MNAVVSTILQRLDQQDEAYHRDQAHAQEFQATSIETLREIKEQTTRTNGRVTKLEEDAIKFSSVMPNKHNWKIYGALFLLLVGSQVGAKILQIILQFTENLMKFHP